jgi:hypothetical protein
MYDIGCLLGCIAAGRHRPMGGGPTETQGIDLIADRIAPPGTGPGSVGRLRIRLHLLMVEVRA